MKRWDGPEPSNRTMRSSSFSQEAWSLADGQSSVVTVLPESSLPTTSGVRTKSTQCSAKPNVRAGRLCGRGNRRSGAATPAPSRIRTDTFGKSPTTLIGQLGRTDRYAFHRAVSGQWLVDYVKSMAGMVDSFRTTVGAGEIAKAPKEAHNISARLRRLKSGW